MPCVHHTDNQFNCDASASERRLYFAGTVLTLKGAVLTFACLDCMGTLTHPPYEVWRDPHSADDGEKTRKRKLVMHSPSSSQDMGDHQFAVICSEKQAKVFSLPSQTCLYVHNITETSFLLRADVVTLCNSVCLACFCANGHIMTLRYLSNWLCGKTKQRGGTVLSRSTCICCRVCLQHVWCSALTPGGCI